MSVFYKIASVLLYVVFGISIVIMGFFYFGEKLIDETAFNDKKAQIETPEEPIYDQVQTEAVADSAAVDTTAEAVPPVPIAPPKAPQVKTDVKFTFFEKLVYYKTDVALGWAYILIAVTLLLAIIFPLIFMFSSVKNMIRTLGILVAAAVMVGVAYLLSSGAPIYIPGYEGTDNANPNVLKYVDTGIFVTYFLIGLAMLSILYSEVAKIFK